jgi:hypothetical protein
VKKYFRLFWFQSGELRLGNFSSWSANSSKHIKTNQHMYQNLNLLSLLMAEIINLIASGYENVQKSNGFRPKNCKCQTLLTMKLNAVVIILLCSHRAESQVSDLVLLKMNLSNSHVFHSEITELFWRKSKTSPIQSMRT